MKGKRKTLYIVLALLAVAALIAVFARQQSPFLPPDEPLQELVLLPDDAPGAPSGYQETGGQSQAPPEAGEDEAEPEPGEPSQQPTLAEDGSYTSKEDVALYIHIYGHLPGNFITKKEAEELGWPGGSLEPYAPGKCIGGSRFGNYEGALPAAEGRRWTECDIDTLGAKSRGAKRIVFSNDGLIYYTDDHYKTFELLYGEG